jgi:hypothetical protein
MRDATQDAVARLKATMLFTQVGEPIDDDSVLQVFNWNDAWQARLSQLWQYLAYDERNCFTRTLARSHRERYQLWNSVTQQCRPLVVECVDRSIEVCPSEARESIKVNAQWSLLNGLMEVEYADVVPPAFFTKLLDWYMRGHYPCGWEGEYPEGKLIVF